MSRRRVRIPRDLRALADKFTRAGGQLGLTNGGHIRWTLPNGGVVFSASSPSDWRATKAVERQLARKGWEVKEHE